MNIIALVVIIFILTLVYIFIYSFKHINRIVNSNKGVEERRLLVLLKIFGEQCILKNDFAVKIKLRF